MQRLYVILSVIGMLASVCLSDEGKDSSEEDKNAFGGDIAESMKGVGDWFKNVAEDVKEKSESGVDAVKEFSDQAKEKSESGIDAMKGFAGGIGDRFSKAKEKIEESGEKMKEAITNAAEKSKDEFETAASKISKHAKDASQTMFSMFDDFPASHEPKCNKNNSLKFFIR